MRNLSIVAATAAVLLTSPAAAMSVNEFLETAGLIPRNPAALLHPGTRRLMGEVRTALRTIRSEQNAAAASGRAPVTCIPERATATSTAILERLNAIPENRRSISVTHALREWMVERYPCR